MKTTLLTTVLVLFSLGLFAQVSINTDGSSPDGSAMLDVKSTDKGMLVPRMTTTQRTAISSPATGLLVFDETTGGFWFYNGSAWEDLSSPATFVTTSGVTSNENGTYASDDFVFGSPQLDKDGDTDHDSRMFFDKDKGAFRAGYVTGTHWDVANIGDYSTAMGAFNTASGMMSTAMGGNNIASGPGSTVMGSNTIASGGNSTAMGNGSYASGDYSTAMGYSTTAESGYEMAVGKYDTEYTPISTTGWDAADRLFVIGNGQTFGARSDAMVILKNGNTGFGTSTPDTTMHILGKMKYEDGTQGAGKVLTSDANGLASWQASVGDNMGNHTATQNINLNGNYLSGNGTSEGIFVGNDGQVGIGTSSPEYELDIGTAWATHMLRLTSKGTTSTGDAGPIMEIDGGTGHWGTGSLTGLEIDLSGNSVSNRYAAIFNGGKVGIGTSTPSSTLEVSGTVTAAAFVGDGSGLTNVTVPGDNLGNHSASQNITLNGNYLSGDGGNEGLSVDANGEVGIGTTTPTSALDVNGGNISLNGGWLSGDGGNEGVFVSSNGNVGIGTDQVELNQRLTVQGLNLGDNSDPDQYVAKITNTSNLANYSQGILALQFTANLNGYPGNGNWIQFFENETDLAGKIENNNNGDVQYQSGGSDYAELLERLNHDEEINAGDIVGVFGGKISKRTVGADWVMAVSDQAVVLGNAVYDDTEENYEIVSFIGQIPVYVNGKVNIGDYILASGENDGTAIAVSPLDLQPEQGRLIVGRAWEAKETVEVARVNAVVGLPEAASTTMALTRRVEAQQAEIEALQTKVNEVDVLKAENVLLKAQNVEMKSTDAELKAEIENIKTMLGMNNPAKGGISLRSTNNK